MRTAGAALAALFLLAACSSAAALPPAAEVAAHPWPAALAPVQPTPAAPVLPAERVLAVRLHLQQHNLTCEAAALEMALSYEGIAVDELTLLRYMTIDPRPAGSTPPAG